MSGGPSVRVRRAALAAAVLALGGAAACEKTAEGLKQDAERNEVVAREVAREVSAEARQAAEEASVKARAAATTLRVKTALAADQRVDASRVDVDTNEGTKSVVLRGSVPDAGQILVALDVARGHAAGYSVASELLVVPVAAAGSPASPPAGATGSAPPAGSTP